MRLVHLIPTLIALIAAAGQASAACAPLRLGYMDQHRPPYYLGTGPDEASPPGAGIDLLRELAAYSNCTMRTSRLPLVRLRAAVKAGQIDAIPLEATQADIPNYALPVDASGNLDPTKALRLHTVVFVRAADTALRSAHPARAFNERTLGLNHAAPMATILREQGVKVDDGAIDAERNLEKLMLNRIDGYAISVSSPSDMDAWVAAKFGNAVVRMEQPLVTHYIWLAMNKDYYARNRATVDAMWAWLGETGRVRFAKLIKKYDKNRAAIGN